MGKKANKRAIKRTKKKSNTRRKTKKRISDKVYKKLLSRSSRTLNKNDKQKLDKALKQRYCGCLKKLGTNKRLSNGAAFGICGTSVYLNRGLSIPDNAARSCGK